MIVVVVSVCTDETTPVLVCPAGERLSRAPRGRATAPRPPYAAALGVFGERSSAAVQLGERVAWKGAPGDGLTRSPLWRGIIKMEIPVRYLKTIPGTIQQQAVHKLTQRTAVLLYTVVGLVGGWVGGVPFVLLLQRSCCSIAVHGGCGWVSGWVVAMLFAVNWCCNVPPVIELNRENREICRDLFSDGSCCLYRVWYSYPDATGNSGTEPGKAEGFEEIEGDRRMDVVEIRR